MRVTWQVCNRGLLNVFTGTAATPQQAHDLFNFRKIGSDDLVQFRTYHILRQPSADGPLKCNRFLTMAAPKIGKHGVLLESRVIRLTSVIAAC